MLPLSSEMSKVSTLYHNDTTYSYIWYLSQEHELLRKLYREGLPEGKDMAKGAVLSSLGTEVENG